MGAKTRKLANLVDQLVEWQSVVVADGSTDTNSVAGRGYFIDTSAGAHTLNLPSSPKFGDIVKVSVITAGNDLTIERNGNNINGAATNLTTSVDGDMFELVFTDTTEGWKAVGQINAGVFTSATGGTVTTSGNFKIHSFTGDGCFVVSQVGNGAANPLGGPAVVDYVVVAGGGGGGNGKSGGGGAGGFRESHSDANSGPYTASPLSTPTGITVTATTFPITVGGGGAGTPAGTTPGSAPQGSDGSNSVFSTITSAGGGGGGSVDPSSKNGRPGGSGGGASQYGGAGTGGTGNTPPVSPAQGKNGGAGYEPGAGGGGGGATANGTNAVEASGSPAQASAGDGGNGATTNITGSPVSYAGGGGGGMAACSPAPEPAGLGTGGTGGGGNGVNTDLPRSAAGGTNQGGGGGGSSGPSVGPHSIAGGAGGKGIVIIRYKFQ
tara:strand:+ start:603 stop:1910 length:1308 start_codon:yes stop_codon:yes gene_type:complete